MIASPDDDYAPNPIVVRGSTWHLGTVKSLTEYTKQILEIRRNWQPRLMWLRAEATRPPAHPLRYARRGTRRMRRSTYSGREVEHCLTLRISSQTTTGTGTFLPGHSHRRDLRARSGRWRQAFSDHCLR
jgi:hypothetical protein